MLSDQYQITDQPTSLIHVYLEKGNRTETPHSTSPNVENLQQTPRVTLCGGLKKIGGWQVLFVLIFTLFLRTANFPTRSRMRKNFPMVDLQKNIQSFNTSGLKIVFQTCFGLGKFTVGVRNNLKNCAKKPLPQNYQLPALRFFG